MRGGAALGSTADADAVPGRRTLTPAAGVQIETRAVPLARGWYLGFDGALDHEPLFSMTRSPRSPAPAYLAGLTMSVGLRVARAVGSAEVAIVGRAGAARNDSKDDVAANDSGRVAAFYDAAIEVRDRARDLSPFARGYGGVRHDQRFHRAGDLSPFDDPTGRVFIGGEANPIRIGDPRGRGGNRPIATIGASVEWEGALRGATPLPSGFRVALRAAVNVR